MGTWATGECFRSFLKFSQTFTSVSIERDRNMENMFSISFRKHHDSVNSLCSHHYYVNSSCLSVFQSGYRNTIFNQSACVFS